MEFTINLGKRSYPTILEHGFASTIPVLLKKQFHKARFALITNTTLSSLYSPLIETWKTELDLKVCVIPDGEKYKTIDTWKQILDFLIENKFERSSVLLAFGGGVVGDITGFAAYVYLRGIPVVQIPSTLLAMVDSSIGGKTAVDHPMGKNLIGGFHQPGAVFVDTDFLKTLSQREFVAGYAELFKYAFIGGHSMYEFIKENNQKILGRDQVALLEGIRRSIEIKAHVVEQDEFETKGLRALLNFGHTFAHSLERFYNFGDILHGEAVLWGIKCACDLAKRIGTVTPEDARNYDELIEKMPLPQLPSKPDAQQIYSMMFTDKKVEHGKIRFVVPTVPGVSVLKGNVDERYVIETLTSVFF